MNARINSAQSCGMEIDDAQCYSAGKVSNVLLAVAA